MHRNILQYWRNSLVDGNRLQKLEHQVSVSPENIKSGNIGPELARQIKNKYRAAAKNQKDRGKDVEEAGAVVPVLVCPICLKKKHTHYEKTGLGDEKIPLWIPAVMNSEGKLHPAESQIPWIARDLLEPKTNRDITIGDMEDVEDFLSSRGIGEIWSDWNTYYTFAEDMLRAMPEGELKFTNYAPAGQSYIMPDIEIRGAAMYAIILLDYLLHYNVKIPALLKNLTTEEQEPLPLLTPEERCGISLKHVGQMGKQFPLNESQREALHHCLNMKDGEVLAVNGPPGTGKTTLMHSVVASLWTEAALKETDPPVILAVSSNNQAVTNMIDSFGRVSVKGFLSKRWIPEVNSYGLYCPSAAAAGRKESEKYQLASPSGNDFPSNAYFPAMVEAPDFIAKAEEHFLDCAARYFNKKYGSVKSVRQSLHKELSATLEQLGVYDFSYRKVGALLERYQRKYVSDLNEILPRLARESSRLAEQKKELEADILEQHQQYENHKKTQEWLEKVTWNWINHVKSEPWYYKLFFFKSLKKKRDIEFFKANGNNKVTAENIEDTVKWLQRQLVENKKTLNAIYSRIMGMNDKLDNRKKWLQTIKEDSEIIQAALNEAILSGWGTLEEKAVQEKHDVETRYKAFLLATHYWEARWLEEVRDMQKNKPMTQSARIHRKWRRYLMLTPCIVSTLYVAPRLFTIITKDGEGWAVEPIFEFVDYLIIDEAGQVPPELAAATFALSKKAIVVGDIMQIEPIYKVTRFVDQGNLISHGVIENKGQYEEEHIRGLAASCGSVMLTAQKACRYEKGMLLTEHRRCLDEIISYSNDLAYGGKLIPMRGNEAGALPPFGYLHINSVSVKSGCSRKNEIEARAICDFIINNREIIETYGPLKEAVAVVMPFSEQKKAFFRLIYQNKKYYPLKDVTIGTIHSLQGSERDIVIFSPVYTKKDQDEYFFDRDVRMLNVAVSRAKNSFIVIGDTRIFDGNSNKPSGLLARKLFKENSNLAEMAG